MGRRRRNSVVQFVVLGAAVSIGVVALTSSRFGWRRTKAEPLVTGIETSEEPPAAEPDTLEPSIKPAPPRPANAPRWDSPPADYVNSDRASP
jgi:hypothetical protein